MRSKTTAHLPEDLAAMYDAMMSRRGEIARGRLARGVEAPEPPVVTAEAEGLDADLRTLRNPESTPDELAWVRNWGGRPEPAQAERHAEAARHFADPQATPSELAWARNLAAEAEAPAAEADAPEMELEAAI